VFRALTDAFETDKEKCARYAELLYGQALLIAGVPIEDPVRFAELICELMG
jgi:molecular chaperone HtpG